MIEFEDPTNRDTGTAHHSRAAAENAAVAESAAVQLSEALRGQSTVSKILLKAAAGAGKSYVLKRLVSEAANSSSCKRIAVVTFQNRQVWPLAAGLGEALGRDKVCLFTASDRVPELPEAVVRNAVVATKATEIPTEATVILGTSHKFGAFGEARRLNDWLGAGANGTSTFDVLFVDEAWQLPHYLFDALERLAPIVVGVGDVGQLPPLEVGANPWRGDSGHNPYRAWPTTFEGKEGTWSAELPAVWRPTAEQLPLWRAFYPEWSELDCVAAPGDRTVQFDGELSQVAADVWGRVATGVPVLLEVDGLPPAEAADVDLPLVGFVEGLLDELFAAGFRLDAQEYGTDGDPTGDRITVAPGTDPSDPLVAVLATRNQAVDDAAEAADRLRERHSLNESDLTVSTVDRWQGQTNGITVAVHPLSGASALDEFNSAFGRLAVTCTRATHGLLVVTRPGLDELLAQAPARPGTPFGEPGNRRLPRQTHQRILEAFSRGRVCVTDEENAR
jgi:hypothetical protein